MDRQGKIAVALAILVLLVWQFYFSHESQKVIDQRKQATTAAEAAAKEKAASEQMQGVDAPPITADAPVLPTATATAPQVPLEPAKIETISAVSADYSFSNLGGGMTKALLRNHEAERGTKMALNEFGTIPIGAISELPGEGINVAFETTVDAAGGVITFQRTDKARQLQVTKRFALPKVAELEKEYLVELALTFTNLGAQPITLAGYYVHTGSASPIHEADQAIYTGFKASGSDLIDVNWFGAGGFLFFGHPDRPVYSASPGNVAWAAVTNQYFTTLISPTADAKDAMAQLKQRGASVWATRFPIADEAWNRSGRHFGKNGAARFGVNGAIGMPGFTLEPGKEFAQRFQIYAGPGEYRRLAKLGSGAEEIMDFGIFGWVSKLLLNSMNWLNSKLGSYAAAIVVLTLLIKTLLWPLQNKATNSMKRMQALQPKMQEIREKYQDDPTRMNTEVMKLYKDYGVNPVGGCFPMLIQIPIFFGFYNMLGKAVELRNSQFLWVDDLSLPDTVWEIAGIPLNILPLLMAGTMFWQMAISPKSGDPVQQRIFMFMPLIFVFFCYNFASALALYWTVQNLFSVVQLYATRNQAAPTLVKKVTAPAKKK